MKCCRTRQQLASLWRSLGQGQRIPIITKTCLYNGWQTETEKRCVFHTSKVVNGCTIFVPQYGKYTLNKIYKGCCWNKENTKKKKKKNEKKKTRKNEIWNFKSCFTHRNREFPKFEVSFNRDASKTYAMIKYKDTFLQLHDGTYKGFPWNHKNTNRTEI